MSPLAIGTLSDLQKAPDDADSQAALRKEIRKAAERDPEFAAVLPEQLSKAGELRQTQVANLRAQGTKWFNCEDQAT